MCNMLAIKDLSIIELNVNGTKHSVAVRPADTLLFVLREKLGLTGAKNGCESGDCASCTVIVDNWPVKACLMLAVEAIGHEVLTIEGLHNEPIQMAFMEKFATACGYCTPGMIMNCYALIKNKPQASDDVINEWLEGNLCRCTGYEEIRAAIKSVL